MRNAVVILRSTFCSISDAQFAVTASTRHMPALAGAFVSFALVEKPCISGKSRSGHVSKRELRLPVSVHVRRSSDAQPRRRMRRLRQRQDNSTRFLLRTRFSHSTSTTHFPLAGLASEHARPPRPDPKGPANSTRLRPGMAVAVAVALPPRGPGPLRPSAHRLSRDNASIVSRRSCRIA